MFLCPLNPNVFAIAVHTYPYVCIAATHSIPVFTNLVHLSLICHSSFLFYLLHFVCARSQVLSVVFHSWTGADMFPPCSAHLSLAAVFEVIYSHSGCMSCRGQCLLSGWLPVCPSSNPQCSPPLSVRVSGAVLISSFLLCSFLEVFLHVGIHLT